MSKHPFDTLLADNTTLLFTPCPGTKTESIDDSIKTLKKAGAQVLLTLMFKDEMALNNAQTLPEVCAHNDMAWYQLPIMDDHAPDNVFEEAWQAHKTDILEAFKSHVSIAVHCKGGTGRTGLVIALILAELGWPKNKIIEEIQKVKTKSMRIPLQVDYFNAYQRSNLNR